MTEGSDPLRSKDRTEEPAGGDAGLLICPTCDEPFTPRFVRRCGGCGHEFPDGFDDPRQAAELAGTWNARVIFCLAGVVLTIAAAIAYYWLLF
jgi:hypothetical protein